MQKCWKLAEYLKKFLVEDQQVEAGKEDKERDYLKMLKTVEWESKAEVGMQGREITVMKDNSTRESVSND